MKYGLIGEKLPHSFSKIIHEELGDYNYELFEVKKEHFDDYMNDFSFDGANVTIPYKEQVIPYLHSLSETASKIGAVNTIIKKDNKLYGYNTDYYGLKALIEYNQIIIKNKLVLIFGTGGTAKMAKILCQDLECKNVCLFSRQKKDIYYSYEDLNSFSDEDVVIINATPVGMYPNNSGYFDLSGFKKLSAYIDVVYNPLRTMTALKAPTKKSVCGLFMLVAQAVYSHDLFLNKKTPVNKIVNIYEKILKTKQNIVLIGMPTSGKSYVGKRLASKYNKPFADTDNLVEENIKMPIDEYIKAYSVEKFRREEKKTVKDIYQKTGQVIATGGGLILDEENVLYLKQNGMLYYLNRPLDFLKPTNNRPLSSNTQMLENLYSERTPLYLKVCDVEVKHCNDMVEEVCEIIEGDSK